MTDYQKKGPTTQGDRMQELTINVTGLQAVELCGVVNVFGVVFGSLRSKLNPAEAEFLFGKSEAANSVANTWIEDSVPTEGDPHPQRARVLETDFEYGVTIMTPGDVSIEFSRWRITVDFGRDSSRAALNLLLTLDKNVFVNVDGRETTAGEAARDLQKKLAELAAIADQIEEYVYGVTATVIGEGVVVRLNPANPESPIEVIRQWASDTSTNPQRAGRGRFRVEGDTVKSATNVAPE